MAAGLWCGPSTEGWCINLNRVFPYSEQHAADWDEFVARAPMTTFLHTRRYLAYHGERFRDMSMLFTDEKGRLAGLFPAAVDPQDDGRILSHPGVTFGGVVHEGRLHGEHMLEALESLSEHYAGTGFRTLRYKAVPYIYQRLPSDDDLYALFRLNARRYRCDLTTTIDLANRPSPSERRRRRLKKALKSGVKVKEGTEFIESIWNILGENLARKHGVSPVHTAGEIEYLHSLFPEEIVFVAALVDGQVEAGVVLFATPRVLHAQYIAASAAGQEMGALEAVLEYCIDHAHKRQARYFDFGISNEDEGRHLNVGLEQFKTEFGGGGVVHEFYELNLRP